MNTADRDRVDAVDQLAAALEDLPEPQRALIERANARLLELPPPAKISAVQRISFAIAQLDPDAALEIILSLAHLLHAAGIRCGMQEDRAAAAAGAFVDTMADEVGTLRTELAAATRSQKH